jgi:hypothetical protein
VCRGRCGVAHIEQGLFDLVGETGVWRIERDGSHHVYVAMEIDTTREPARAELVRRYLRCHGPSTPAQFAEWCGISTGDATSSLNAATVAVEPARVEGVRLLPPRDPYLLGRDRETLVPDRDARKRVWRATPTDGVMLVDGDPVATWRARKKGRTLVFEVEPFAPVGRDARRALDDEAAAVAALRGCVEADVAI